MSKGWQMAAPKKVDYDRIEPGWRAGILSPRQLAAVYTDETGDPVSHAAICNHFKRKEIPRDLAAKIKAKSDAMVTAAIVTANVTPLDPVTEKAIVDGNAAQLTTVRLSHRQDIKRGRSIVMRLLDELELQTGPENAALLEELGVLLRKEDDKGVDKLNDLYQRVISLPGRAKTMKDLGETLRVLIGLERQAFGLDDAPEGEGGDKSFLEAMLNARARAANR